MNSESSDLTLEDRDAPPMTDHDRMNYWWRRATQAEQRIRDLTQEVRDERAACLDQMEQVQIRDARIKAVEDVLDRVRKHLTAWVDEYGHEVYQGNGWAEGVRDAAREALKDLDGEQ